MQQEDKQLAAHCQTLSQNTHGALAWIEQNKELIGKEYEMLHKKLRGNARDFHKCHAAALRKMCVGVFGPSQSGKSYLISALARDAKGTLIADFAGTKHDFITEINPEGGKESTGLVTRFTTTAPPNLPAGHPIRLRLLTECDVVRVLANTYYADCDHKETPDQDSLLADLQAIEKQAGTHVFQEVSADDVEELREYMHRNFASRPRAQMLHRAYWQRAMDIVPRLDLEGRAKLFALIWDKVEAFTELYTKLCSALHTLGYPEEAHCGLDALIPRESSIIDVALLKNLSNVTLTSGEANDRLTLTGKEGRTATLPRPIVTALTAEITIYMTEKPDDFFDHTDLLDFPGYRSRLKITNIRSELEREGMLETLFLRGKVAYLFERYCAEKELTSMLLCIAPGNQEVQDLPRAVQQWIASTHGETPERRAQSSEDTGPALFFILTKMDMEFEKKKGTPSVEARWTTRLQSSLIDFFGQNDDWPTNWDGARPFNNVFLLRNPNFRCEAIFDFKNDLESGIRPDQESYVAEVKSAFFSSALVQQHVNNPERIWDAAMSLNDGGVGLLRQALRPLCNPALKRRQIAVTLQQVLENIVTSLSPHWKSDDKEEERKQKELLAQNISKCFIGMAKTQRFGDFLCRLQVCDHDLHALYFQIEQERLQQEEPVGVTVGKAVDEDDLWEDLWGNDEQPAPQAESTPQDTAEAQESPILLKDSAERFVNIVIQHWMQILHSFADNVTAHTYFQFPERELGSFVHEIVTAFERLGLPEIMVQEQRRASRYGDMMREKLVWKQVSLAANTINSFVNWLSFDPRFLSDEQRTVVIKGRAATIFTPMPEQPDILTLDETPKSYERTWYTDWLRAFIHLVNANVDFDGNASFNREENAKLQNILNTFKAPLP